MNSSDVNKKKNNFNDPSFKEALNEELDKAEKNSRVSVREILYIVFSAVALASLAALSISMLGSSSSKENFDSESKGEDVDKSEEAEREIPTQIDMENNEGKSDHSGSEKKDEEKKLSKEEFFELNPEVGSNAKQTKEGSLSTDESSEVEAELTDNGESQAGTPKVSPSDINSSENSNSSTEEKPFNQGK